MGSEVKTAVLYVRAGEFDDQAGVERVFNYTDDLTYEQLQERVGRLVKENFNDFADILAFTFNCAYSLFYDGTQDDFPTLQKLFLQADINALKSSALDIKKLVKNPIKRARGLNEEEEDDGDDDLFDELSHLRKEERQYLRVLKKCIEQSPPMEVWHFMSGPHYDNRHHDSHYTYFAKFYPFG
jgi:hypothetical protein